MKSVFTLSFGLLLCVGVTGCSTCGHRSCWHKLFSCGCGCHNGCDDACCNDGCGGDGECTDGGPGFPGPGFPDAGHKVRGKRSKSRCVLPAEAAMYGYDKSVVYTGDDWQGIPQPMMDGAVGCAGCGVPMMPGMSVPSAGGCAGCSGGALPPVSGGCAGCAGGTTTNPPAAGGCAGCAGGTPTPAPATGGGCASCGAPGQPDAFYSPMAPHQLNPAPAPPAESIPGTGAGAGGDKAAESGSIQKIHWVPRQL